MQAADDRRGDKGSLRIGITLGVISAVAFGTMPVFAKNAYDVGAQPIPLLAVRFTTAALLLLLFVTIRREGWRLARPRAVKILLLGGLAYAFEATLYFAALERAPASIVALIFYSYPLWTNLSGFAIGLERFDLRLVVALVLSGAGILLIFSIPSTSLAGPLIALGAALAVTVYYLFAQVLTEGMSPLAASIHTAGGAAVSLTIVSGATGARLPAGAIIWAICLGAVTAVAFACLYGAVTRIGSARTSIAHMLEPVTTVLLAAALLGEDLTTKIIIGALLVVSALPILATKDRRAPVETPVA